MTGPEHYAAAEELLREIDANQHAAPEQRGALAVQAQVHATLAQTAATAYVVLHDHDLNTEWAGAVSPPKTPPPPLLP